MQSSPGAKRARSGWLVAVLSAMLLLQACGPNPTEAPSPTPSGSSASNLKITSILLNLFVVYQSTSGTNDEKTQAVVQYARDNRFLNQKDEAEFELTLTDANREKPLTDKIKSMGGIIRNSSNLEGTVKIQVAVPLSVMLSYANTATKDNFLADLATFEGVQTIDVIVPRQKQGFENIPQTREALLAIYQASKNEGVKMMGADKWHAAGFRGQGVKVGVIDGGFKYYQDFLGSTLPENLQVRDIDEEFGGEGTVNEDVHGTAVLEIIHSLAPEAEIIAASIDGSDGQFKSAIDYLVSQNVNLVSVSMGGHGTAGDGSSPLDKYIEKLRKEKGIVFLFSSGNEGAAHYVSFFNPDSDGFHQFIPGVTRMAIANNRSSAVETSFILNWEQWGLKKGELNDLDVFVVDSKGSPLKGSQDSQAARPPVEYLPVKIPARSVVYVRVRQKPNTLAYTKPFRLHIFGHNTAFQFLVPQMAVGDPADSKGALAVGANQWDEDKVAYYSSQGPLPDGRFKPEISAPAGVSSRAYQEDGGDVFDGTSAACPEAAGIATLLKGANPGLTADQLEALLKEAVRDLAPAGPDYGNGYGRLSIAEIAPSKSVAPQGKAVQVANADVATLQFPVQVLNSKSYPAPQVSNSSVSSIIPKPLPTKSTSLNNGVGDEAKPSGVTASNPPAQPSAPPATTRSGDEPPPAVSGTVYKDDFRDKTSGLPNSGNTAYQNGKYVVKASGGQLTWAVYPPTVMNSTNFGAEVTAEGISSEDGLYGIIFWHNDDKNYYLFSVTGTGDYQITRYQGGSFSEVTGWETADNWNNGKSNTLRLVSLNGQLQVAINGKPSNTIQANGQGAIGFAAGSFGSTSVQANFTNFRFAVSE